MAPKHTNNKKIITSHQHGLPLLKTVLEAVEEYSLWKLWRNMHNFKYPLLCVIPERSNTPGMFLPELKLMIIKLSNSRVLHTQQIDQEKHKGFTGLLGQRTNIDVAIDVVYWFTGYYISSYTTPSK